MSLKPHACRISKFSDFKELMHVTFYMFACEVFEFLHEIHGVILGTHEIKPFA